jgi:hypothetical protein
MDQARIGSWENNASEYARVEDGAGSRRIVVESTKKVKWEVRASIK